MFGSETRKPVAKGHRFLTVAAVVEAVAEPGGPRGDGRLRVHRQGRRRAARLVVAAPAVHREARGRRRRRRRLAPQRGHTLLHLLRVHGHMWRRRDERRGATVRGQRRTSPARAWAVGFGVRPAPRGALFIGEERRGDVASRDGNRRARALARGRATFRAARRERSVNYGCGLPALNSSSKVDGGGGRGSPRQGVAVAEHRPWPGRRAVRSGSSRRPPAGYDGAPGLTIDTTHPSTASRPWNDQSSVRWSG